MVLRGSRLKLRKMQSVAWVKNPPSRAEVLIRLALAMKNARASSDDDELPYDVSVGWSRPGVCPAILNGELKTHFWQQANPTSEQDVGLVGVCLCLLWASCGLVDLGPVKNYTAGGQLMCWASRVWYSSSLAH